MSIPSLSAVSCTFVLAGVGVDSVNDFSNSFRLFSDSFWAFLNSPTELPMDLASSGSLAAPKRSTINPKIAISSGVPIMAGPQAFVFLNNANIRGIMKYK
ncbi:hypothetical protein SDC9_172381 [bioreactor metagenome]|uniref:Uncharacterized protein n=1 Tax=bioreactor metagenome TaxID=1076179 RepID=A0A645GM08_9ZZZZ